MDAIAARQDKPPQDGTEGALTFSLQGSGVTDGIGFTLTY